MIPTRDEVLLSKTKKTRADIQKMVRDYIQKELDAVEWDSPYCNLTSNGGCVTVPRFFSVFDPLVKGTVPPLMIHYIKTYFKEKGWGVQDITIGYFGKINIYVQPLEGVVYD